MFAQEAQRCDDSELSHLLSLAGQAGLADLVEARPDEPDEQRSHGLIVLLGGPATPVSDRPTSAPSRSRTPSAICRRGGLADDRAVGDAEQVER